ncbi:MAG: bacterial transcriptional activator domain-containing protein [Anaerolineales bacterium]|nr:bacterial transcriptional activator domain-containing protein [Anaerolineales bacterium]
MVKREGYCRQALLALRHLTVSYAQLGELERALPYAWHQIELEPFHEQAHQQVMRLLALIGQRGAALVQYRTCQSMLQEIGIEPAQETTQLYEMI